MAATYSSDVTPYLNKEDFMLLVDIKETGCWEWNRSRNTRRGGYGQKTVNYKVHSSHRLSYLIFNGDIPGDMLVCHKCDNPPCCNPDHLFLGTHKDNAVDAWGKGRMPLPSYIPRGNAVWSSKLTESDVLTIFEKLTKGVPSIEIQNEYNISRQTVYKIGKKLTWKHLWTDAK